MIKLKDLLFEQETLAFDPKKWFKIEGDEQWVYKSKSNKNGDWETIDTTKGKNAAKLTIRGPGNKKQSPSDKRAVGNIEKAIADKKAVNTELPNTIPSKTNPTTTQTPTTSSVEPYTAETQPDLSLTNKDANAAYDPGFRTGTLELKWYDALLQQEINSQNSQYTKIEDIPDAVKKKIANAAEKFAEKQREKAFDQKYKTATIDKSIPKDELMSSGVDFNKALFRVSAVKNPKVQVINYTEGDDGRDYYLVKFINKRFLGPNYGYVLAADFKYDPTTNTAEYQGDKDGNQDKYRVFKSNV